MTQIIRGIKNLPKNWQDCAVAIGKFDGLHLGHQALLHQLKKSAGQLPTVVVSFYPNPSKYFAKNAEFLGVIKRRDQLRLLKQLGIDYLLLMPFNRRTSALSPDQFLQMMFGDLKAKQIIVGQDFCYGKNRAGDVNYLLQVAENYQATAQALPLLAESDLGEPIKSSLIRQCLQQGDLNRANKLLGYRYAISGRVVKGDQVGRQLGFKTANIHLKNFVPALRGVFAVDVYDGEQLLYRGAANLGCRPTVEGIKLILEVHCIGCDDDLYGKILRLEFIRKVRDEKKFGSLDDLKKQIAIDVSECQVG